MFDLLFVLAIYVFFAWLALYSLRAIWRWLNRHWLLHGPAVRLKRSRIAGSWLTVFYVCNLHLLINYSKDDCQQTAAPRRPDGPAAFVLSPPTELETLARRATSFHYSTTNVVSRYNEIRSVSDMLCVRACFTRARNNAIENNCKIITLFFCSCKIFIYICVSVLDIRSLTCCPPLYSTLFRAAWISLKSLIISAILSLC